MTALPLAAALGGHLVHVIIIGGALLLAATVYGVATVTAPRSPLGASAERAPLGRAQSLGGRRPAAAGAQQLAFLGLCAAAGTHLAVMPDHFAQSWLYGSFFAVVAPLQLGLAWLVLARPHRRELSAALAFCLGVVLLWAFTRFVGVPIGPDNGATEELGVLDVFATAAELLACGALALLLLGGRRPASAWRWSLWSPLTRVLLAATALAVPLLSAFASRS